MSDRKGVQADEISRSYDIKINVSNPKNELLPGMVCSVKMENMGEQVEDVEQITVPITAVQQSSDNNKFVWENKDGKAHRVNVILGETVGNRITIVSGLKKGDIVIVKGYQKLGEGTKTKN